MTNRWQGVVLLVVCALHGGVGWCVVTQGMANQPPKAPPIFQMVVVSQPMEDKPQPPLPANPDPPPAIVEEVAPPLAPAVVEEVAPLAPAVVVAESKPKPKPREKVRRTTPAPVAAKTSATATSTAAPPILADKPVVVQPPLATAAYLQNPKPIYPLMARRQGWEGVVVLRVRVSAAGEAVEVSVKQGSGYAILDQAAGQTVRQWRFVPARRGEVVIAAEVDVPIRFSLKES